MSLSGTWNAWRGLSLAAIFSASSATPINEITGSDDNQDRDRNDRPIEGTTSGIVSDTDAQGRAVKNGVGGEKLVELNLSVRYNFDFARGIGLGLYWDGYNITNNENLRNPTGNRSSSTFLVPTSANFPRQMQFGVRFTF